MLRWQRHRHRGRAVTPVAAAAEVSRRDVQVPPRRREAERPGGTARSNQASSVRVVAAASGRCLHRPTTQHRAAATSADWRYRWSDRCTGRAAAGSTGRASPAIPSGTTAMPRLSRQARPNHGPPPSTPATKRTTARLTNPAAANRAGRGGRAALIRSSHGGNGIAFPRSRATKSGSCLAVSRSIRRRASCSRCANALGCRPSWVDPSSRLLHVAGRVVTSAPSLEYTRAG
jgi:hypothetical protein